MKTKDIKKFITFETKDFLQQGHTIEYLNRINRESNDDTPISIQELVKRKPIYNPDIQNLQYW